MKHIKLMPDYQCFPLWDLTPDAYGDLDPKALPISELLQGQLMDWARTYDQTLNWQDPARSGFVTVEAKNSFEAEGLRLANQLREELGAEYAVLAKIDASVHAG